MPRQCSLAGYCWALLRQARLEGKTSTSQPASTKPSARSEKWRALTTSSGWKKWYKTQILGRAPGIECALKDGLGRLRWLVFGGSPRDDLIVNPGVGLLESGHQG